MADFRLSDAFIKKYRKQKPPFGFDGLGELVYFRTYSRVKEDGRNEVWWETVKRVVEGTYNMQKRWIDAHGLGWNPWKAQKSAQEMFDRIFNMKFLPPGRGLWAMGTAVTEERGIYAALNNCFEGEEEFLTPEGYKSFVDTVDTTQTILTENGEWKDAPILSFGNQRVYELTLQRQGIRKTIRTTDNHRWFGKTQGDVAHNKPWQEITTKDLTKGTRLRYNFGVKPLNMSPVGIQHGFAFGDGTVDKIDLQKGKDEDMLKYFAAFEVAEYDTFFQIKHLPLHFKDVPDLKWRPNLLPKTDRKYLLGWLAGYFAADGSVSKSGQATISSSRRENLEKFQEISAICGIGTYSITEDPSTSTNYAEERSLFRLTLIPSTLVEKFFLLSKHRERFKPKQVLRYWNVVEVIETSEEAPVYCASVEGKESFTLKDHIFTKNCAFVSTENLKEDGAKPFCFLMDASMLGVGVGFDTKGAGKMFVKGPNLEKDVVTFKIPDTREGWVESLKLLIDSYLDESAPVEFDYSAIRAEGAPIKVFGGVSSGFKPLRDLHIGVQEVLDRDREDTLSIHGIVDIMNMIGKCVVAGNVRRTAEIVFGDPNSDEYLDLKNYEKNPEREEYGWTSNNSVFAELGMDYGPACERVKINGEPGFAWLENMRGYSRMRNGPDWVDSRVSGGNPCLEQSLESYELCCVSGDTRILTKNGYPQISSVIGKEVEVWNGEQWSTVKPFLAAKDKDLYKVTISDGSVLEVTDNHEWSVKASTERTYKKKSTLELEVGEYLQPFEINVTEAGNDEPYAYEYGWFAGDGYLDHENPLGLIQENEYSVLGSIQGTLYKEQHPKGYKRPFSRISFKGLLNFEVCKVLRDKEAGLPEIMFSWDQKALRRFFGGWIDTDGTLRKQVNTDNYVLFGTEKKLRDAQILIRKIGINHATLSEWQPKGHTTNFGTRNQGLWALYIPSYEADIIATKVKVAERYGSRYKVNNAHPTGSKIDSARKQKIVSIEKLSGKHDTFCFTEPFKGMGVFGNCLTYQCLVETFPMRHESYEDYQKTLKYAYLYAKTVTLGKTHWPETNRVLLRNRRIGCSVSGVAQFITNRSLHELKDWLMDGYDALQKLDQTYSDWMAVPRSIKTTSVKPSGTVSLLAGATPGVHYPESRYYLRRIRLAKNSPLVKPLEKAGYNLELAFGSEDTTLVVTVPVDVGEGIKTVGEVSIWEQMALAAFMQRYWADNQVSCTVTFDPEKEGSQIAPALDYYQYQLKGISFLPKIDKGAYRQMPYEAVDEAKYMAERAKLKPIKWGVIRGGEAEPDKFCDGDTCTWSPEDEEKDDKS